MKKIKFYLFISCFLSCCANSNSKRIDKDIVIEKYEPCSESYPSTTILYNELCEYEPLAIFGGYLDSIIQKESGCQCYKDGISGFDLFFYKERGSDTTKIRVTQITNVLIKDYYGYEGYFVYKKHVFALIGEMNDICLKKKSNLKFYSLSLQKLSLKLMTRKHSGFLTIIRRI